MTYIPRWYFTRGSTLIKRKHWFSVVFDQTLDKGTDQQAETEGRIRIFIITDLPSNECLSGLTRSLTLLSVKETPARRPENQYSFELFSYTSASSPPPSPPSIPHSSSFHIPPSALPFRIPYSVIRLLNTHYSPTTHYHLTLIHHPIQQYSRSHSCIQRLCSAIAGNGNPNDRKHA